MNNQSEDQSGSILNDKIVCITSIQFYQMCFMFFRLINDEEFTEDKDLLTKVRYVSSMTCWILLVLHSVFKCKYCVLMVLNCLSAITYTLSFCLELSSP